MNRLRRVTTHGQSLWLDFIDRDLMASGALARMIEADGISGLTSNPAIFEKAIAASTLYDASLRALIAEHDDEPAVLFERLAIPDIQSAADVMRPVFDRSDGADGYVSFEVAPHLCADTAATVREGRRLWHAIARPNLMIKVPATPAGIAALRELLIAGINVNVTLLFSRTAYRATAAAYIDALEIRAQTHGDVGRLASVASFFVSRIDSEIDARIEARIAACSGISQADVSAKAALEALLGQVAIANAKLAYRDFQALFADNPRWQRLEREFGARPQRLLWASTGTKNPHYRDVRYIETLIGAATVNTVPPATLDAFRDHGEAHATLALYGDDAERIISEVARLQLDLDDVTAKLLREGLAQFQDADDRLNAALAHKRTLLLAAPLPDTRYRLTPDLEAGVTVSLDDWRRHGRVRRLWARDASLWTQADEAQWLDWLDAIDASYAQADALRAFGEAVRRDSFTAAVLLGMGGSSLGPEVIAQVLGNAAPLPLRILDSTDPAQIRACEAALDLTRTLFIVSSKSGNTLEVDLLCRYFHARVVAARGAGDAGANFVAITDPGSKLESYAIEHGFRRVFSGNPRIGGRYSVLSNFGMVPAAAMGLDPAGLLREAARMRLACAASVPPAENPGVRLGLVLAAAARAGRDKLTLLCTPALAPFGAWVEQLVAESTGKHGLGIVPVDAEPVGPVSEYGSDRIFLQLRLESQREAAQDALVAALAEAGHPVVVITLHDPMQLGGEFFRWEIATAVAGSVLGINPFDQPDVESAKLQTRALLDVDAVAQAEAGMVWCVEEGVSVLVDAVNGVRLEEFCGTPTLAGAIGALLAQLDERDYFALLAFIAMTPAHREILQRLRSLVRAHYRAATCLNFGPRYLHSTGQLHKGGPNNGIFLQITADAAADLEVPGRAETFGRIEAAQAAGDLAVLQMRHRRALRVHLGADVDAGLQTLQRAVETALSMRRQYK